MQARESKHHDCYGSGVRLLALTLNDIMVNVDCKMDRI